MIEIRETVRFAEWLDGLRDLRARARVQVRIERLASGHVGDAKPVGEGVSELRIDYGPGYRVYFTKRGSTVASCWRVAISAPKWPTLRRHYALHGTCRRTL